MLSTIEPVLRTHLSSLTCEKVGGPPPIEKSFAGEGGKLANPVLLSGNTDWHLVVDYTNRNIMFSPPPPWIVATSQRREIVLRSVALKKVIMVELTCPAEEGIEAAVERKLRRCTQLKQVTEEVGWVVPKLLELL